MKFSELKNKKNVTAYVREPFNKRIKFKVEEQSNAITGEDVYKIYTKHKGFSISFYIENQQDVDFWKLQ